MAFLVARCVYSLARRELGWAGEGLGVRRSGLLSPFFFFFLEVLSKAVRL